MNDDPYSRFYHRFAREFPHIYADDAAFAAWGRLLMAADAAWPLRPALPRSVRPKVIRLLVGAGLLILEGDYYTCRGLDAERERRRRAGKRGAAGRWGKDDADDEPPDDAMGNAVRNAPRSPTGNAPNGADAMPRRDETRRDEILPPPPAKRGRRKDGTNPRATGDDPRANGTNLRASGESPKQQREAEKRGGFERLGEIMAAAKGATDA
jgi:hypothetical protein